MMKRLLVAGFLALIVLGASLVTAQAADHRDSPTVEADPAADIADVYAFRSPENSDNLVVAVTVNGLTAPAEPRGFPQGVEYRIHVDNTGDLVADATATVTFQGDMFTVAGLGDPITGRVTPPGTAQPVINEAGGVRAFAGPRDDPFFFDLVGFRNFVSDLPMPANGLRPAGQTPVDQFAGTNVSAIVLELPVVALTGADAPNTGTIRAWASTARGGAQVDRMAIPAINTALIPSAQKQAFNEADPADDAADFRATAQSTIEGLRSAVDDLFGTEQDGGPLGDLTAAQVATALIPDVVTIDFAEPVQFPNGRRLQDDVIDAALGVVLNRGGAAGIADAIDGNDLAFSTSFPFMAAPHLAAGPQAPAAPTSMPGAPVTAPNTGTGTGGGASTPWWIAGGLALAAVFLGGGLYLRRRSV
jgi:hypothetical protein